MELLHQLIDVYNTHLAVSGAVPVTDAGILSIIQDIMNWLSEKLFGLFKIAATWLVGFLFGGIIWFVYIIAIFCPLYALATMCTVIRYLAGGFVAGLFGYSSDGTMGTLGYNINSPLFTLILYIFGLAVIVFFFYFLMSMNKRGVDDLGNKITSNIQRFISLRWLFLMIFMLFGGPAILMLSSILLTAVIGVFTHGTMEQAWTSADLSDIKATLFNPSSPDSVSTLWGRLWNFRSTVTINNNDIYTTLNALKSNLQNLNAYLSSPNANDPYLKDYASLSPTVSNLIQNIDTLLNNMSDETIKKNADILSNAINSLKEGQFSSSEAIAQIGQVKSFLNSINYELWSIGDLQNSFNSRTDGVLWESLKQYATTTNWDFTYLNQTTLAFNQQLNFDYSFVPDTRSLTYYFDTNYSDSIISSIMFGDGASLSKIIGKFPGASDQAISQLLYQAITNDPDPNNWSYWWSEYYLGPRFIFTSLNMTAGSINPLNFVFGIYCVMAMFKVIMHYVNTAARLTFNLAGYWIFGWFILANGLNDAGTAKSWYTKIFGFWFTVMIMMFCFNMGITIVTQLAPICMDQTKLGAPWYFGTIGGWNFLGSMVTFVIVDYGMQASWLTVESIAGTFGSKKEGFSTAKSTIMSVGKTVFEGGVGKLAQSAKNIEKFAKDTKKTYKESKRAKTYNKLNKNKEANAATKDVLEKDKNIFEKIKDKKDSLEDSVNSFKNAKNEVDAGDNGSVDKDSVQEASNSNGGATPDSNPPAGAPNPAAAPNANPPAAGAPNPAAAPNANPPAGGAPNPAAAPNANPPAGGGSGGLPPNSPFAQKHQPAAAPANHPPPATPAGGAVPPPAQAQPVPPGKP